uniref:hypothetical protein n=1 Tax=Marinobacterium profundum TaxID=1714300 RepID=UPI00082DB1A0|nr:hypothetical protein [Marinobacterium profundum]
MNVASFLTDGIERLGLRFVRVNLLPTGTLTLFVIALVNSGAPGTAPDWHRLMRAMQALDTLNSAAIGLLIVIVALALEALQTPIVRMFEGYWGAGRLAGYLGGIRARHWRKKREKLRKLSYSENPADKHSILHADQKLQAEFPSHDRVLPTRLGNILRAAEDSAGQRYGLQTVALWPRLYPFIGVTLQAALGDVRDRLDMALRWVFYLLIGAIVSAALLAQHHYWLTLPAALSLLALGAYLSACLAAKSYGVLLATAFDLHRFDMLRAMRLPLPQNESEEKTTGQALSAFLTGQKNSHGLPYTTDTGAKPANENTALSGGDD